MTLTLTLGSTTLDLETGGYYVRSIDPGYPAIREVTSNRPGSNGADDTTSLFGPRVVSLDIVCQGTRQQLLDDIADFLLPSSRPILTHDTRRIQLRPAGRSMSLTAPANIAAVQVQFVAPDGVWESATATTVTAVPSYGGVGRNYPGAYNKTYAVASPTGSVVANNTGTAPAYPVVTITGEVTNPSIYNTATGTWLKVNTTVYDGETLVLDYKERTILKNNDTRLNYAGSLDWGKSSWVPLAPGSNLVIFAGDSYNASAAASITFRSAFI